MKYQFIGRTTGKIYITCKTKSEGFRKLKEKYPTYELVGRNVNKGREVDNIYPEPLIIYKNYQEE